MLGISSLGHYRMLERGRDLRHSHLIVPDFPFTEAPQAYETFQAASQHQVLKVAIDFT